MTYEVEIKSLVQNPTQVKYKLNELGYVFQGTESQLNHYFSYDDYSLAFLYNNLKTDKQFEFSNAIGRGSNFSIRTRGVNDKESFFVIKYSVIDEDSANGNIRKELEVQVGENLEALDQILLNSGLTYASKWSRTRETFEKGNVTATIDLNAGYGYLLELEVLVDSLEETEQAKQLVDSQLVALGLVELDKKLLGNMFKYYEQNWSKFYGTTNYLSDDADFQTFNNN